MRKPSNLVKILPCMLLAAASSHALDPVTGLDTGSSELIDTCAADDYEQFVNNDTPSNPAKPIDDPYGLKEIHFHLVLMDLDSDGRITEAEISEIDPRSLGYWNKYDINKDGAITGYEVKEFIEKTLVTRWRNDFRSLDRNRNGTIEERDLLRVYSAHLDQIDIQDVMSRYDLDHSKTISITEYLEASKEQVAEKNLRN